MDENPIVDILTCTYNHEKYISSCIEGVINQKTSFKIRHIIGEDCSTDKTREIIKSYQEKFPNLIHPIYFEKNVGAELNSRELFKSATGKYIALLDGDDYWIDPEKLTKQVEFLENNPNYVACYHGCKFIDENENVVRESKSHNYSAFSKDELISGRGALVTHTVVFRNVINFPKYFDDATNGDAVIWHLLGFYGAAKFMNNIEFSAYRVHSEGIWTSLSELKRLNNAVHTKQQIRKNLVDQFGSTNKHIIELEKTVAKDFVNFFYQQLYHKRLNVYFKGYKLIFQTKEFNSFYIIKEHFVDLFKRVFKKKIDGSI